MFPVIALVGRPNVGKSTLFNRLTKSRDALVADFSGLTRDRMYGHGYMFNRRFLVIDTGGIGEENEGIGGEMTDQSFAAVEEADTIFLIVDCKSGITSGDYNIAEKLRRKNRTIYVIANKIDGISLRVPVPNVSLVQFNFLTIMLGLGSMILAFSYPFMKRITYWPQLFLGLTFNWGIIMAWTATNNNVSYEIIILYISAIFWTLGYDTIYGVQDVVDDEIIGIKSTAIKFKNNIKLFVSSCYLLTFSIIAYLFKESMGLNIFTLFLFMFFLSLIYQLKIFKKDNPNSCLKAFKTNNLSGLLIFLSIFFKS